MHEIKLPQLGQSVEEAEITQWLKKEGDAVEQGEPIFTIQTDKAEIEAESTASGILRKILIPEEVEVPVLTVVALVGDADEALPDLAQYAVDGGGEAAPVSEATENSAPAAAAESAPASTTAEVPAAAPGGAMSPRARSTAQRLNVDPAFLSASGPEGRVIEEDVLAYDAKRGSVRSTPTARRVAREAGIDITTVAPGSTTGRIAKDDVVAAASSKPVAASAPAAQPLSGETTPLSPMRRIIAERMVASKFDAPHFYVTIEVDMKESVAYRGALPNFKPSFNDLVMRATARAIQAFPTVNSRWLGDAIESRDTINLGFAVAMAEGLIVPVVKDIQTKSLQDINRDCKALAEKARTGKLVPDDYAGNTFTVSNLGAFGVDSFTAIINQPDSAILAIGQIKDRVVVIDGGMVVRPIMKLTLSSDHRVIDGSVAAQFMGHLKTLLETADF
ncbi:MAG: 2-oxo acid dehydrogenase subunit E2 [Candidatus Hydrogenedentes bacterium]|nr:2-oxo acid dehydrogenase subunit E2 [Candidatus Hydrogenedentota bacterium]